ncbi:MAG: zf-HC2 domain-containing protein [Verrucomicrobia bacterium]|nr:zf-HC2 domain-containing protein [Verrucomicrobiota bacterium]
MNHPTHEDLVAHLYGELPPEQQAEITAHLNACADCRQLATNWHKTMRELDAWKLPAPLPSRSRAPQTAANAPFLKWAIAACLAVGFGFLGGRLSAPAPDTIAVRAEFAADLRKLAVALETQRTEDRLALTQILQTMQGQRAEDYATLRRELETLAVNTEDGLSTVVQLAAATEPNAR